MLVHLALQIFEHHVSEAQLFVCGHVLGVRQLTIEGHDGAESVALRNQPQLARCEVIVVAGAVHLGLFHGHQVVLEEILDREPHDNSPNVLAVIENARVLLLLLSAVEEAAHEADDELLEDPFEHAPQNPKVLVLEVAGVIPTGLELEPLDVVDVEAVEDANLAEGLESVELDERVDLLVEDLFVLSSDEILGEDLRDEFSQEISHLSVFGISLVQLLEDGAAARSTLRCLFKQMLLFVFPVCGHRAILAQVVVEVELLLIADDLLEHFDQ